MNIFNGGVSSGDVFALQQVTQNQAATPGVTDFTGVLEVNGLPIVATGGPFLPLAGGTMAGDIAMGTNDLLNVGTISGATISRGANDIVSNIAGSTSGDLASFSGATGKVVTDSGIVAANVAQNTGAGVTSGDLVVFSGTGGRLLTSAGTSLAAYLPLAGGTMSGAINMGAQEINNLAAIRPAATNVIIGQTATVGSTSSVVIGDASSSIGAGGTVVGAASSTTGIGGIAIGFTATATGNDSMALGYLASAGSGSLAVGRAVSAPTTLAQVVGSYSTATGKSVVVGEQNNSVGTQADIFGSGIGNSTAQSLIIGTASYVNIRPASTTCDLGTVALPFQTLRLNANVAGATNSRAADDIVSNAAGSTPGDLASFSGATGKVVTDSGIVAANVAQNTGAGVTSGDVVVFSGTGGRLITSAGAALSAYLPLAGGTMSGSLNMGSQTITAATTIACSRVLASAPSCYSAYNQPIAAISYTAATAKLIDLGTFSVLNNPASEFASTAATGKVTYSGSATRYFRVTINFSLLPVAGARTLTFWVSKNGSLTQVAPSVRNFTTLSDIAYTPASVSAIYQLATNDTVQLAGLYSNTENVSMYDAQYIVEPMC